MKNYERRVHEGDTGEQYAYDPSYRLMQVKKGVPGADIENPNATTFTKKRDYLLDSIENIIKITTTLPNNQTSEIVTEMSTANARKLHQYNKYDGWVLEYDNNGNTTRKINQFFSYNFKNQLVQVTGGGQPIITFKYDALGRRIEKSSTSATEKYYYAGNQMIEVRDGSDSVKKQFVYGNGIDEPVRMDLINGGTTTLYYYHSNQIGSITAVTNSSGDIVERVKYDDYGKPTFTDASGNPLSPNQSSIGNNILFQGREYEPELNLYYYRARYYDPAMGRFLQTDPVGYQDSMNLYQAMNQNPMNFIDPFGELIYKWNYLGVFAQNPNNSVGGKNLSAFPHGNIMNYITTSTSQGGILNNPSNSYLYVSRYYQDNQTGKWHAEFNFSMTTYVFLGKGFDTNDHLRHEQEHILGYQLLFLETLFKLKNAEEIGYNTYNDCVREATRIINEYHPCFRALAPDWWPRWGWFGVFLYDVITLPIKYESSHYRMWRNFGEKIDSALIVYDILNFSKAYQGNQTFNLNKYQNNNQNQNFQNRINFNNAQGSY